MHRAIFNHFIPFSLFLAFLLVSTTHSGQPVYGIAQMYSKKDGLPISRMGAVCQSRQGFLWIGSDEGLIRFDGYRFETLYEGRNGITDNNITDVAEGIDGRIWVGGFTKGITLIDPKTNKTRQWPQINASRHAWQTIYKILPFKKDIWIGTNFGLGLYNASTDSFTFFIPPINEPLHHKITDIVADTSNGSLLWMVSDTYLYSFNIQTKQYEKTELVAGLKLSPDQSPQWHCIDMDRKGSLWIGGWFGGIHYKKSGTNTWIDIGHSPEIPGVLKGAICLDIRSINDTLTLFALGNSGIWYYNPEARVMLPFHSQNRWFGEWQKDKEWGRISSTPEAGVWMGSRAHLMQWHPGYARLNKPLLFEKNPNEKLLLLGDLFYDREKKFHIIACAGAASLLIADSMMQQVMPFYLGSIPDKAFSHLAKHPNGLQLALAWKSHLLYELNIQTLTAKLFRPDNPLPGNIRHIMNDTAGNLWLITPQFAYRYFNAYEKPDSFSLSLSGSFLNTRLSINNACTDMSGKAWIATNQGIFVIDPYTKKTTNLKKQADGAGLKNNFVKSICADFKESIWIGYDGEGLQLLDAKTFLPIQHWDASMLPSGQINGLAMSHYWQLVAATPKGLAILRNIERGWQLYDQEDGIPIINLDQGMKTSPAGKIVLANGNDLLAISDSAFNIPLQNLNINITNILVNGQSIDFPQYGNDTIQLNLPYNQNNIEVEFAALHWLYPQRTRFNFTVGKIKTQLKQPRINLAALKPGKYLIMLEAIGTGELRSAIKYMQISIKHPFWLQWWFIAAWITTIVFTLYKIFQFRIKQLQHTMAVRQAISQNLHDDIGSSLSNIQILNELAKRKLDVESESFHLLEKSAEDVQRVSEALSDIVWNVNPRYDDLHNLFIRMKRYTGDLFDGKGISHELIFPDGEIKQHFSMEQRRDFYLVFKEALNNLVKHSGASKAKVEVTFRQSDIHLLIEDNGKGFEMGSAILGNGIMNMENRTKKWGGEISVESFPGKGTSIHMTMPT